MRIAVLIIGLVCFLILGIQSCAVSCGGTLTSNDDLSQGGAVGVLVTLILLLGAAFVMKFPLISIVVFTIGGILGLAVGITTSFSDMSIWGVVSFILAILSYFGRRELMKSTDGN